jgi:hypothetical protein
MHIGNVFGALLLHSVVMGDAVFPGLLGAWKDWLNLLDPNIPKYVPDFARSFVIQLIRAEMQYERQDEAVEYFEHRLEQLIGPYNLMRTEVLIVHLKDCETKEAEVASLLGRSHLRYLAGPPGRSEQRHLGHHCVQTRQNKMVLRIFQNQCLNFFLAHIVQKILFDSRINVSFLILKFLPRSRSLLAEVFQRIYDTLLVYLL